MACTHSCLPKPLLLYLFGLLTGTRLDLPGRQSEGNVVVSNYKYGVTGVLCISLDFDLPISRKLEADWREATEEILLLFGKYDIPASWGVRGDVAAKNPEVFRRISEANPAQDIGVHTFSHIDLSSSFRTDDEVANDLQKCEKLFESMERPVTFIFPWNRIARLNLLRQEGFIVYRSDNMSKLSYPNKLSGLWDIHGTYYLTGKAKEKMNLIMKLIDFALLFRCVFHIWFHPWNAHIKGDVEKFMKRILEPIVAYAAEKRAERLLGVCTMRELANYCEARESCFISRFMRRRDRIIFSAHCEINNPRYDLPPSITIQIEIPSKWRDVNIYVDDVEQHLEFPQKILRKRASEKHLFLTWAFKKRQYKICLERA